MEQCHKGPGCLMESGASKTTQTQYLLEVPMAQMSPSTESKQPFASLINTYYFYTETLCKTVC